VVVANVSEPVPELRDLWPPAAVVVRTPRVELRWPSDDDLVALAALAADGIHDEAFMPFGAPWSLGDPAEVARNVLRWHWRTWAEWDPAKWSWNPVVVADGRVVGTQGVSATSFGVTRTVESGSWLGRKHQGQGIGKEMRAAMLHLAFAGLDATWACTGAFDDNEPSLGVTRSLGYHPNGERILAVQDQRRRELLFTLPRADWEQTRRTDIELEGVEAARPMFGLDEPAAPNHDVEGTAGRG
jgi:RimJ/RimL family protein N-acetyltransferase